MGNIRYAAVPDWTGTPSYTLDVGESGTFAVPVAAAGRPVTLSWSGPGEIPSYVTLNSGKSPTITFTNTSGSSVTGMRLFASYGGVTVESPIGGGITIAGQAPVWSAVPTFTLTEGAPESRALPVTVENGAAITVSWWLPGTRPTWVTFPPAGAGVTPTISFSGHVDGNDLTGLVLAATANGQMVLSSTQGTGYITVNPPVVVSSGDWAYRTGQDQSNPYWRGVVWYHNFDSVSEVNQFRWTSGYGSGNDPLGVGGAVPQYLSWQASGGADGGGYMRFYRGPGTTGVGDGNHWVRPFSPMDVASTGRGSADPAANLALTRQAFTPTDGGSQTVDFDLRDRSGYYGRADYAAAGNYWNPTYPQFAKTFDGTDFYIQVRVKADPNRMAAGNVVNGKMFGFTNTKAVTYSGQEIVTVAAYPTPTGAAGQANLHNMYEGQYGYIADVSLSSGGPIKNPTSPQWAYSGGWDTLLYHVTPGTANYSSGESAPGVPLVYDTRIEVWAAHPSDSAYTKIWDAYYRAVFDNTEEFARHKKYGWNAIWMTAYTNGDMGDNTAVGFYQSYDQIIFSKEFVPCPAAGTPLEQRAAGMVAGEWRELVTNNFTDMLVPTWQGTKTSTIIEFSDRMSRHDSDKRVYFIGCARGNVGGSGFDYQCANTDSEDAGYISYDEKTNTWIDMPTAPVCSAPHAYNGATIDQSTGDYYQLESHGVAVPRFWKRAGGTSTWTNITYPPSNTPYAVNPIEWFPEIDSLVTIYSGDGGFQAKIHYMPRGQTTWTSINVNEVLGQYGVFSRYSPQHGCIYFGGGEVPSTVPGNPYRVLIKFTESKAIVRCQDAPIDLFGAHMSVDPVTGNLLALDRTVVAGGTGRVYSFNGTSWTQHGLHGLSDGTGQLICTATPIPSAGVVMFVNWAGGGGSGSKVYLYKHS